MAMRRPSGLVMRVCQTLERRPTCKGVASPVMVSPTRAAPRKLVLLSSVVVPWPGRRFSDAPMAPRLSAKAMSAPPCRMWPDVQRSSRTVSRPVTRVLSASTTSTPISVGNGWAPTWMAMAFTSCCRCGVTLLALRARESRRRERVLQALEIPMGYRVAVVGATGNVGREMLNILEELNFPVDEMHALASRKSIGVDVGWKDGVVACKDIEQFDFSRVDLVLMSVSGAFSKEWAPRISRAGPLVIDNSSAWRMDPDVPLIVPEVNPDAIELARRKNIIANPNCSTAQLVVALKPLHDAAKITRAVVSTYQSVSGAGKAGMDELWDQTKEVFVLGPSEPKFFPKPIAFNVIPFIGKFLDDG